jgi:hypothetical protein
MVQISRKKAGSNFVRNERNMTIAKKIQCSADKTKLTLFKEGLFYKVYNEDAMVFAQQVKNYKVSTKFVKCVGENVLSLGFPASEVEKGNLAPDIIAAKIRSTKYDVQAQSITFYLSEKIMQDYHIWKHGIVSEMVEEYKPKPESIKSFAGEANYVEIVAMIKNFDLANSTPMDGLIFIQQLKKEVQKIEANDRNL